MKKGSILFFFGTTLMLLLCSCKGTSDEESKVTFSMEEKGSLGSELWIESTASQIKEVVNKNSVRVKGQSLPIDDYMLVVDEFFYEKSIPFIISKFIICNPDGTNLNKTQYEEVEKWMEQDRLAYRFLHLGSSRVLKRLKKTKEGRTEWIVSHVFGPISERDKVSKKIEDKKVKDVYIIFDKKEIGKLNFPDYAYEGKTIGFDTSKNDSILYLKATELGISVIWDITDTLAEFTKLIKSLPPGESAENYGYDVYESVYLQMKNGTVCNISPLNEEEILRFYSGNREPQRLGTVSALWKKDMDLEQIECICIDGEKYYVKK